MERRLSQQERRISSVSQRPEMQNSRRMSQDGNESASQNRISKRSGGEWQQERKYHRANQEQRRPDREYGASRNAQNSRIRSNREARRGRTSGGSRYADKATQVRNFSGKGRRPIGRKKRRRNKQPLIILILLVLIVCLLAAVALVYSRKRQTEQAQSEIQKLQSTVDLSMLVSPYAILLDGESDTVLASKKGDEKIFPASMVKIMTVLTAIRSISDLDASTTMSADFYDELYAKDASRAGFEPGEEAKIRDLLYGALLPSGAECCMQLAIEAAGSEDAFVGMMNQNALEMGLTQTHFTNVTGLHNEEQYSTPHEIGEILRTALKNKTFYQVFTTHSYTVQPTSVHPDGFTFWSSLFKNITDDSVNGGKIMGGKTGYTDEAGHCLASMAKINGKEYILVTAGWAQTDDTKYHISDAFRAYNQIAPTE